MLLEVNGEPLIERQIHQLHEVGIHEIYVVVGFMKEQYEYLIDDYGMYQIILRPLQPFLCHQLLFIQFLTRAESSSCQNRNNFFSKKSHKIANYCITLKKSAKKELLFPETP